jgi:hypothetical protein
LILHPKKGKSGLSKVKRHLKTKFPTTTEFYKRVFFKEIGEISNILILLDYDFDESCVK